MDDKKYMALAIELAKATRGQTSPNPSVGAVLVKSNQIIGFGSHLFAGSAHAEIYALNMNSELNNGSTLYVTLEPCCHFGKTPPCINAIIQAKVKRVVIAVLDKNPIVAGNGARELQNAGIIVDIGIMEQEVSNLNKEFFHFIAHKTPYVTLKVGMSLDAKLATSTGESKWITNSLARIDAHGYRHTHDAILIGVGTVIADNPSLTTRLSGGGKNPIRIVLDTNLRTPLDAQILNDNLALTWIVIGSNVSLEQIQPYKAHKQVTIIQLNRLEIDAKIVLLKLGELGITSILIEGGNKIYSSFLEANLINQLVMYISPILIGGENAVHFFANQGYAKLNEALKMQITSINHIGDNIKIVAHCNN